MLSVVNQVLPTGRRVYREVKAKDVPFMAGSIAYRAFLSLLPLLILLFFAVALLGDEALAERVLGFTESFLPQSAQEPLRQAIVGRLEQAGVSVLSGVVLVWGSLGIFRGLDLAFSEIYDTERKESFLANIGDALIALVTLGLALAAAAVATTVFTAFGSIPFVGLLSPLFLAVGLTVAFLPIYYFFPDVDLTIREVLPGVVTAAVGWTALQALFQVYVAFADKSDTYGVLGGILLLMTWLYFGGLVFLLGAVVNDVVVTDSADDRDPFPGGGAEGGPGGAGGTTTTNGGPTTTSGGAAAGQSVRARDTVSRTAFAHYLRRLHRSFGGEDAIDVRVGEQEVRLHPGPDVEYEVEVTAPDASDDESGDEKGDGADGTEDANATKGDASESNSERERLRLEVSWESQTDSETR